ncbi:hypothetical protein FACS1894188_00430 [Clostridia bacterium]|nr:hypothetical protein FACS1894188_00430 [Clostridia bacterium]
MNDRIILIKGDNSKWYEQAIFIIRPETGDMPVDFVDEAENIINNYMIRSTDKNLVKKYNTAKKTVYASRRPPQRFDIVIYFVMAMCCIILAYIVYTL